jgi:hypothetical protein
VAIPDLYPKNKGFQHEDFKQLEEGIRKVLSEAMKAKRIEDRRINDRFKVFCFKHDLEALLLASEEALKDRLATRSLRRSWRIPVEDQDHDYPPKRIVEDLFRKNGKRYVSTVDAPVIMHASRYQDVSEKCFQCFKPFIKFLTNLKK